MAANAANSLLIKCVSPVVVGAFLTRDMVDGVCEKLELVNECVGGVSCRVEKYKPNRDKGVNVKYQVE